MQNKLFKRVRVIIGIVVIGLIAWMFLIKPTINFHNNERKMEEAARRYFELNSNELPSGERVKTLSLQKLYDGGLIDKDFYIPLSKKTCSNENSWAKVRRENGEYKYYVYLECGYLKSKVDHEGPEITLNGKEKETVARGSKYKEKGVKNIVDSVDGDLKTNEVIIKGNVDTSKIGTYEVTYTAFDKLRNKTVVTREIKVVRKLYNEIKKEIGDNKTNFIGNPENNYVRLSNMIFRIYGYDENKNVILVSSGDIANVNYTKLDEWLDYYYNNLNDNTKKMIVEKKYCSMTIDEKNLNKNKCESYTEKKKVYIPSIVEVNKAEDDTLNFMKPSTISWIADKKSDKEAYLTRSIFWGDDAKKEYITASTTDNYGVRPMITIKGNSLIVKGNGTLEDPYTFGDVKKAKGGTNINQRQVGEYLVIDDSKYRIVELLDDGTTKIISDSSIGTYGGLESNANYDSDKIVYDPKDKDSIAYFINNKVEKYVNTKYFVAHEVKVPIYKNKIIYKEEEKTKTYKLLLSAPNMYDMFSAQSTELDSGGSYWLINYSKADRTAGVIQELGVPLNEEIPRYENFGVRIIAYLKKDTIITNGEGTSVSPYKIG